MQPVRGKATQARAQAIALALVAEELTPEQQAEITPLALMLRIMRARDRAGDNAGALAAAIAAAPYCHSRLTAADLHVTGSLDSKSDADIAAELAEVQAKLAAAKVLN
jgi:hypothetical protein